MLIMAVPVAMKETGPIHRSCTLNGKQLTTLLAIIEVAMTITRSTTDTQIGRAMVCAFTSPPIDATTVTMTRPTTSSIMAAVTRTVPSLVAESFAADRIAKVVPSEVDERDAPAANAVRDDTFVDVNSGMRMKDKAIGNPIPVIATSMDGMSVSLSNSRFVVRPPAKLEPIFVAHSNTFIHE